MGKANFRKRIMGTALAAALVATGIPIVSVSMSQASFASEDDNALQNFLERLKRKKAKAAQSNGSTSGQSTSHSYAVSKEKATTETEVVVSKNIAPMLTADGAEQMRTAAERYRAIIADGGFPKVSRSNLKKGSTGKGVATLNRRLYMEGYVRVEATEGEFASIFTSATEDGLRRFQQNMGLAATGRLDAQTADYLNISAQSRLAAIEANIPRIEIYAQNLGDRYVVVNIPAQQIETVSNGRVFSRHNAIVGRPERPSPVVMTAFSDVNFNPYWNAPASIVEKDIIPKLRSGTQVLEDMNIKVFQGVGGPEIDPRSVNWRTAIADNYHFRQEPGEGNAMATAKINFPSPFGVYMHDTPEKQLFATKNRFYSSGCVRVQDIPLFVNWVLNGQDGIGEAEIATLAETLERRDVKLVDPPQIRFAYLTAWPTTGGTIAFRHDVYELDGTGFTVGQPMPVGELSPDGKRFVLKPLPRLVASVEDDSGGSGFFGFKRKGNANSPTKRLLTSDRQGGPSIFSGNPSKEDEDEPAAGAKGSTKQASKPAAKKTNTTTANAKTKKSNAPGLFDWAAWRKEQAALAKQGKTTKTAAKKPKDDGKKLAKKKVTGKDEKAVAEVDKGKVDPKKKTNTTTAKAADKAKTPAVKKDECKAAANGTLPKGCKTAEAEKVVKPVVKPKPPVAAN